MIVHILWYRKYTDSYKSIIETLITPFDDKTGIRNSGSRELHLLLRFSDLQVIKPSIADINKIHVQRKFVPFVLT